MATIGELIINVKAGTASFAGDLTRVKNLSFDTASQIQRSFSIIGTAAVGMLAAFGASMAAMVEKTTEFEVHILHLSESAGVTTETMSALAFASKMLGMNVDEVAKAMERFDKQLILAQQGKTTAVDIMKTMGIDPAQIKTSDEALMLVAKHFAEMPDGVQKTGEAMAAFGKAGAAIIPMLKDLAEGPGGLQGFMNQARALGLILDKETGESALRFQQNLTLLGLVFQGVSMDVMKEMLPKLIALTDSFVKGAEAVERHKIMVEGAVNALTLFAKVAVIAMEIVGSFTIEVQKDVGQLVSELSSIPNAVKAVAEAMGGNIPKSADSMKKVTAAWAEAHQTFVDGESKLKKYQDTMASLLMTIDGVGAATVKGTKPIGDLSDQTDKASAAQKKLQSALDSITSSLKIQNATFHQSAMDVELYKLTLDGATYAQRQHVLALYITNQGLKDQAAYLKIVADQAKAASMSDLGKTIDEEGKAIEQLNRANEKMPDLLGTFQDLPPAIAPATWAVQDLTDKLNEQIKTFGKSDAQLQIMGLDAVGATQAQIDRVIALQNQLKKLQDGTQGVSRAWKQMGDTMARDFTDMITAGKSFNAVLQDILKSIIDMLMKQALFGDTRGSTGGGGGIFGAISTLIGGLFGGAGAGGGILGDAGAGSIGDIFGGAAPVFAASGGDVSAGQPLIVGEQGPELFMPATRGAIIPNGQDNGSGPGNVTINYNIDARGADPGADRRIRQAIQDSQDIAVRRAMAGTHELKLRTG